MTDTDKAKRAKETYRDADSCLNCKHVALCRPWHVTFKCTLTGDVHTHGGTCACWERYR